MRVLVSGADADDLSDVVDVLRSNQVEFEYSENGDTILVPEDKRAAMRMELAMKGLPRSGDVGFEIFDEGNFGISDFVQRTNHTRAIQGELQRTIAMMDSIKSAKVFIVKKIFETAKPLLLKAIKLDPKYTEPRYLLDMIEDK